MEKTPKRVFGGTPMGWRGRHLVVIGLAALGTYAFLESRAEWSLMHRWNRALGDTSLVMVSVAMAIGPLARLTSVARRFVPWRRELGIHAVLLAIAHTVIILGGWIEWDMIRLFGYQLHPLTGLYVMLQHGFGLANVIGIAALVYGVVLALTSNDLSQRRLGGPVWKFLQQGAYVLWMLIVIHTAYFLYLHFQDFHRPLPDPNWARAPFVVLVGVVALLQVAAFITTWRGKRVTSRTTPVVAAILAGVLLAAVSPRSATAAVHGEILSPRGAQVYRMCKGCHSLEPGKVLIGPSLVGVFGRPAGSEKGFPYSDALAAAGVIWNDRTLDQWLANPQALVPFNRMPFPGLRSADDRKAVIEYLKIAARAEKGAETSQ